MWRMSRTAADLAESESGHMLECPLIFISDQDVMLAKANQN